MQKFIVTGMSCAACVSRVEKAVGKVEGVESVSVNLLTGAMGVEGNAGRKEIAKAVQDAGYGVKSDEVEKAVTVEENNGVTVLRNRLTASLIFLVPLMYVAMGHSMWGFALPDFLARNIAARALVQLILSAVILLINKKFFINGFKGIVHRSPNMDSLVALGAGVSFVWSVVILFLLCDAVFMQDGQRAAKLGHSLYFESAAMILTLITVGKLLEAVSKGRTTDAIKGLIKLSPQTAVVLVDGAEVEVSVDQVKAGDIFVLRPGQKVPVDGVVLEGQGAVNESALTGESVPVEKKAGDEVSAVTINTNGFLKCRALRVGKDTTLARIIELVSDAAATKAPVARMADKVSGVFVPAVMTVSVCVFVLWLFLGAELSYALSRAIAVLVISCPCALGLATPVAIMVANGKGARNGILFKTSAAMEQTGKIKVVALDKTGTITEGKCSVTDIVCAEDENKLLQIACGLEQKSEHPLSKAVIKCCEEKGITAGGVENFEVLAGSGVAGLAEEGGKKIKLWGTSFASFKKSFKGELKAEVEQTVEKLCSEGKTPLCFYSEEKLYGIIAVSDTIKKDSAEAVKMLKNLKVKVVMITGDNEITAAAIARQCGIEKFYAGVLPGEKERIIQELKLQGPVAMVGDGINDAPALTAADTGIAIGAGSDIAIDAAGVVLVKNSLTDVARAVKLSRRALVNIKENLFWAFIYNVIGIPIAAGAGAKWGMELPPVFGAAAMSVSSFCVVMNALRLNFVKLNENKKIKEIKMEKTISVEGMMCPHCEAHVKEALEAVAGVTSAAADHKKAQVVLTLSAEVSDEALKAAVEKAGYKMN